MQVLKFRVLSVGVVFRYPDILLGGRRWRCVVWRKKFDQSGDGSVV